MIGRDRLDDGDLIPEEYICPICRCLLWKARSCGRCQHLFCEECIQQWLLNDSRCPFRCDPYEDRRCPPSIHSLLSRVNIRCVNHAFGCEEICSYEQLEEHQRARCQFQRERCERCDQWIRRGDLIEHRESKNLCHPSPIRCHSCEKNIERAIFTEHLLQCLPKTEISPRTATEGYLHNWRKTLEFFREQHREIRSFRSSLPLFRFSQLSFFLFLFTLSGLSTMFLLFFRVYLFFIRWFKKHFFSGFLLLLLFTSSLDLFVREAFLLVHSDMFLIVSLFFLSFLLGCSLDIPLDLLESHPLANQKTISLLLHAVFLLVFKVLLFSLRCFFSFFPFHLSSSLLIFTQIIFIQRQTSDFRRQVVDV